MNAIERLKEITNAASLKNRSAQREAAKSVQVDDSQLKSDFDLVAKHYGLDALGEYETVRDIARKNKADAVICYSAMAANLRQPELSVGAHDRIVQSIEDEKGEK